MPIDKPITLTPCQVAVLRRDRFVAAILVRIASQLPINRPKMAAKISEISRAHNPSARR